MLRCTQGFQDKNSCSPTAGGPGRPPPLAPLPHSVLLPFRCEHPPPCTPPTLYTQTPCAPCRAPPTLYSPPHPPLPLPCTPPALHSWTPCAPTYSPPHPALPPPCTPLYPTFPFPHYTPPLPATTPHPTTRLVSSAGCEQGEITLIFANFVSCFVCVDSKGKYSETKMYKDRDVQRPGCGPGKADRTWSWRWAGSWSPVTDPGQVPSPLKPQFPHLNIGENAGARLTGS